MPSLTLPQALQLAAQSLQKGELQQAEQLCRQILAKDANQSEALYLLSAVAAQVNRYDDAINLLKHAIEIKHESRYYDTLGVLLFKTKQYAEAFNFFQKAIEIEPNSEQTKINLKKVSQIRLLHYHVPITRIKIDTEFPKTLLLSEHTKVNIVYFHVDLKKSPMKFSDYTDYHALLENSVKVAKQQTPDCNIILLTDYETKLRNEAIFDEIIRETVDIKIPMYERMRLQKNYLNSKYFDNHTIFVDTDVIFNKNIMDVFLESYDIGLTFRTNMDLMPYNGGVIFAKYDNDKKAAKFFEMVLDTYHKLEKEPFIRYIYPEGIRNWWGDQLALASLVGRLSLSQKMVSRIIFEDIRVKLYPSFYYNFTLEPDIEYSYTDLAEKYIIHFKGNRKQFMDDYIRFLGFHQSH